MPLKQHCLAQVDRLSVITLEYEVEENGSRFLVGIDPVVCVILYSGYTYEHTRIHTHRQRYNFSLAYKIMSCEDLYWSPHVRGGIKRNYLTHVIT